ncbi:hypothetical protein M514_08295 [Trichuris suis]|uniref:Retrotransposon gag domain-containing protein n=1 Tax=Trichuris suis TaxID=68888 RepID=A0A085NHJ1_9BILA|nr:hypothetical protein M513_08295 [Trichuris suis]KFD68937.1 hypothetical protein M514_08295 [Trichuris suis]
MSTISQGSLEPFHLATGIDGWEEWIERFKNLAEANSAQETGYLSLFFLNHCGGELYGLLRDALAPEEPKTKSFERLVQTVTEKLDPNPCIYTARAKFYTREQRTRESAEEFMTELRRLARRCCFEAAPTAAERMELQLRDQFMIGMSDNVTRDRLLLDPKISMADLYMTALNAETTVAQSRLLDSMKP